MGAVAAPYIPPKGQGQFVRVPVGWDKGYKAAQQALAQSGTPMRVWLHGDSIMAGAYATNQSTEGFRWLIRQFLVNKFGQSGDYFPVSLSVNEGDFGAGYTWNGATPPWLVNAPALAYGIGTVRQGVALPYCGMGGDATWFNPGDGTDLATFTTQSWLGNCQAYDVVVPNITAGTSMRWSVDGGATTNITLAANGRIQVLQPAGLAGLSNAAHTILIEGVGASGQPWLSGVTAYKTTRTAPGVQVAHLASNGSIFSNQNSDYQLKTLLGLDATSGAVGSGAFPMCPDLVICDWIASETVAFSPDIQAQRLGAYIELLRRAKSNCSFIFIATYRHNGITTDGAAYDTYALSYQSAIEAQIMISEQYGAAFVNVHGAFQGRGVANGYVPSGDIHPTTAGHAAYANLITPLL